MLTVEDYVKIRTSKRDGMSIIVIFAVKAIWATDVFYLNDSEEFALGIQIARDYMNMN